MADVLEVVDYDPAWPALAPDFAADAAAAREAYALAKGPFIERVLALALDRAAPSVGEPRRHE